MRFQLPKRRLTNYNLLNPNGRRVDPKQEIEPDAPSPTSTIVSAHD